MQSFSNHETHLCVYSLELYSAAVRPCAPREANCREVPCKGKCSRLQCEARPLRNSQAIQSATLLRGINGCSERFERDSADLVIRYLGERIASIERELIGGRFGEVEGDEDQAAR